MFVTYVTNLQNIGDVFVTPVKDLQNIADVFVTSESWLVCLCDS